MNSGRAPIISDETIAVLLQERKSLPANWESRLRTRKKANESHRERDYQFRGEAGNRFTLWIRESSIDPYDFSVGLRYADSEGNEYVLRRYNGPSHRHVNHIEREQGKANAVFSAVFHIHYATELYQRKGHGIEGYAVPTSAFHSCESALRLMISENGFCVEAEVDPDQKQFDFRDQI